MYRKPCAILIQGHPCTGKSFLLQMIGEKLGLPTISRDGYKELLFDSLGIRDKDWSMRLGATSWALLFHGFETLLRTGKSFVVEANFEPHRHRAEIKSKIEKYGYDSLEVLLESDPAVLLHRFKKRWASGERHRGHVDETRYLDLEERLAKEKLEPLSVGGEVIRIDTTDLDRFPTADLFESIQKRSSITTICSFDGRPEMSLTDHL